ncbi:BTAD domain-containing putative transcriptional regulator [Amycolatopsis cihanbeyliensis]|uniref:BTAD domain-containing putative transcriptional regulator n=1 Tax=Amycolatopsis cihanbeyliensis TaxID=1128664 RepID=UPI001B8832C3|nr:BTAD domain-containing putative transcriptional regulator [Amycolatopsis cihanbeyliensis]
MTVSGTRMRALLVLLALNAGSPVTNQQLIDGIWGQRPPGRALHALRALVSRLRRVLPAGAVEWHAAGYRLAAPPEAVDALRFEQRVAAARTRTPAEAVADLREALDIWRGDALTDVADLPFAQAHIVRLEELRISAIEDRIEAQLQLGESLRLTAELQSLSTAHPLRERLRGQLIRALYLSGRQADAVAAYEETRRMLADQLGLDPSPALREAHLAMLRGEPVPHAVHPPPEARPPDLVLAPPALPTSNLRTQVTSFVGRAADILEISRLLDDARLVTLLGPGGVGKTRLAEEVATALEQQLGEVWTVELSAVRDAAELPRAVLAVLGSPEPAGRASDRSGDIDRLIGALRSRHMLLVLDSCEHLVRATAQLGGMILSSCPGVKVIATSREQLGIAGERLWLVEPLALPPVDADSRTAGSYVSVQLFAERARSVRHGFEVDDSNVAAVVRLCRSLDGIPLLLELAAGRLRALSVEQLADRLDDRFEMLGGSNRMSLGRHQTLRAVVDWSWELLSSTERTLLCRIAVLHGGATLHSAERVCRGPGLAGEQVVGVLTALVDKSMVMATGPDALGEPRFRLLDTIRLYALEQLAVTGEEQAVRRAHAEHFLEFAERIEPTLRGHDQLDGFEWLRANQDDLHAAARWAAESAEPELGLRFVGVLGWYWLLTGQHVECENIATRALRRADGTAGRVLSVAHTMRALNGFGHQDRREISASLGIAADLGGDENGGPSHPAQRMAAPLLATLTGDHVSALERAGVLISEPDPWMSACAHFLRGETYLQLRDPATARDELGRALERFHVAGDQWGAGQVASSLADLHTSLGDHQAAARHYAEAIDRLERFGVTEDSIEARTKLARGLVACGEHDRAAGMLSAALDAAHRLGMREPLARVHYELGESARRDNDTDLARDHLGRAWQLLRTEAGAAQRRKPGRHGPTADSCVPRAPGVLRSVRMALAHLRGVSE